MERIQVLIDKLVDQNRNGEAAEKMLLTAQMLQQELINSKGKAADVSTKKVAVIMPAAVSVSLPVHDEKPVEESAPVKKFFEIPEGDKRFLPSEPVAPVNPSYKDLLQDQKTAPEPYILRKPLEQQSASVQKEEPKQIFQLDETQYDEAPTLVQHHSKKIEVHELIGQTNESLNDRLKASTPEVAHRISGEPIKDLRKGIALNDKFVFINELFRGDEAMYERSIKTINNFHILPEAEYWMNRELKVKLGWNDNQEAVQHFYGVVRRRFS